MLQQIFEYNRLQLPRSDDQSGFNTYRLLVHCHTCRQELERVVSLYILLLLKLTMMLKQNKVFKIKKLSSQVEYGPLTPSFKFWVKLFRCQMYKINNNPMMVVLRSSSPKQVVGCARLGDSVTRRKSPNVYKSCPKMISLEQ